MERQSTLRRKRTLFAACAIALGAGGLLPLLLVPGDLFSGQTGIASSGLAHPVLQAVAKTLRVLSFTQMNEEGFGDCLNTYSWSMAWFKGKLYVGTNRGSWVQFLGDPDFHCQGDDYAAEIWSYTPETDAWEQVFKSPNDVPIPGQPDQFAARDNGFRDMIVFREADGTEALYVGGAVYEVPGVPRRPRILRSTDGVTFEPIPQDPGTFWGDLNAGSIRAMAVYRGRLYVASAAINPWPGSEAEGEGLILEAENPAGGNDHFRQVSPPDLVAFELHVFNGFLYVGTIDRRGFSVLKTDARPTGTPSYDFTPVVTNGAFGQYPLGPNSVVLSMSVFKGRLYVGGQTDLIRINPDNTWDLVVGDPRPTPEGQRFPISGLPAGFANPFTAHLWRMQRHETSFYVGTWDFAVFLRHWPIIGPIAAREAGFDLWATRNGVFWFQITRDGLGNKFNHGVRGLVSTRFGLFLGTVNPWDGAQVWLGKTHASNLGPRPDSGRVFPAPDRLEAESQGGTMILSWDPTAGAVRFHIFRAANWPNRSLGIPHLPEEAWIPGRFTRVGTTAQFFFQDAAVVNGVRYAYYVQAEGRGGQLSERSNVAIAPSLAPVVALEQVHGVILNLAGRGKVKGLRGEAPLLRVLGAARAAAAGGDLPQARGWLEALHRQVVQNRGGVLEPLAAEELEILVAKLMRRVSLAQAGLIPVWAVLERHPGHTGQ